MNIFRSSWLLIIAMAIIKFALPFFLQHPVYELHRDEFLYLEQGHHLAWGYMEVPPMISWLSRLTHLLGDGFFWVKCWPALFGAFTLILTCLMVKEFGGNNFAIFIASLCILFTAYLRVNFLFQANFLELFWWTLSAYFITRYINTNATKYLYYTGLAFGLGWLAKNSIAFFILGFGIALLLTQYRKLYLNKHLYGAGLVAVLIALPNLVWQYTHHWPLLHHMNELRETQLKYINPTEFLAGQILMYFAAFFIWIMGLIWLFTKRGRKYFTLAWIYFAVITLLILSSGKSYYSMGVYPMLFAAGAVALQQWTSVRLKWLRWITAAVILFLAWVILPMVLPMREPDKLADFYQKKNMAETGMLKWEDQQNHSLPQDFADYLGWKEMAQEAEKAFYMGLPDTTRCNTIIYCRHYGQAGALKFYGQRQDFRNRVISDNGSFLTWIPDSLTFKHLLFIGRRMPGKDDEVFQHFESVQFMDSVTAPHSRQRGDKIFFFRNIDSAGLKLAIEGLKEMKKEFNQ